MMSVCDDEYDENINDEEEQEVENKHIYWCKET